MGVIARTCLRVLLGCAPILGYAEDVPPFEGQTIADSVLKEDALKVITLIVHATLKCSAIDRVDIQQLGPGARHPHVALPNGAGPATYERWTVSACSKKQPFLMTFYPAKGGGMMFAAKPEKVSDS
jgi:hypothetical protein